MDDNPLGPYSGNAVASCLFQNSCLRLLSLKGCDLNEDSMASLEYALIKNNGLTSLNLSHNPITSAGVEYICNGLKSNKVLTDLDLSSCSISNGYCITKCLALNFALRKINLKQNYLNDEFARQLLVALYSNQKI